jgi:hypothetical protein
VGTAKVTLARRCAKRATPIYITEGTKRKKKIKQKD